MFGVDFISGYNSLIVLGAEFSVRSVDSFDQIYKWDAGPSGEQLSKQNYKTDEWEPIKETLDEVLPSSFGLDWKQSDFILALSFWCEGKSVGKG